MSVIDASVMADALVRREALSDTVRAAMTGRLHGPALLPAEVTSALRGLLLAGQIDETVASDARQRLDSTRMRLHPFGPYAERIWELRSNLTVYDAWYVAVAERLGQALITADAAILQAPGLRCQLIDARL